MKVCSLLFVLLTLCVGVRPAWADDGIFAPAPAAKAAIDFDGRGFLVHGKRTFLVSGTLHYSRVPRALWRDRLLRIKRAGFNTIETYAFWNFHEMQEGKWDFAGDKDFDAYLKLIKELGMYAIVRVGPYVCAEWDSGGYPVWLRFKPGLEVRQPNPVFEAAVDRWYERIIPIVAANQIHKGGAVVMVQLENEHPNGWGKEMPNSYFRHLREKALALGLEVPHFFSGLHHGSDPAGDRDWDSAGRTNPWFTTEFWPGWYDLYGPLAPDKLRQFTRGTWKILAYGGNGYNFYMLYGGTNFDTWNNDEVASNYDYAGAIGQTGDLRPIYYQFKRAALFARSFADILEDSKNATAQWDFALGTGLRETARKSPAGTIVFLDNNTNRQIASHGVTLQPGEIVPFVLDYHLLPGVTLAKADVRILGIARQGDTTTLVVYGEPHAVPAEQAKLEFKVAGAKSAISLESGLASAFASVPGEGDTQTITLTPEIHDSPVQDYLFTVGGKHIRVVALSARLADSTWFVEAKGIPYIVTGFDYVGEVFERDGKLQVVRESYGVLGAGVDSSKTGNAIVYGPDPKPQYLPLNPKPGVSVTAPLLANWQTRRGSAEADVAYADSKWKASDAPLQMGADGDTSAYAWYRTSVRAPKAGDYALEFSDVGDWLAVFVDGKRVAIGTNAAQPRQRFEKPTAREVVVSLKAGENHLAILTAHYGRNKLFNYLGPLETVAAKGIAGPVLLSKQIGIRRPANNWEWRPATDLGNSGPPTSLSTVSAEIAGDTGHTWERLKRLEQDVFNKKRGFAWFRTTLETVPGPHRKLNFENVDDNATVYLNGKKVGEHKGWGKPFEIDVDSAWKEGGPNQLVVLVENTDNTGGINGETELRTALPPDALAITKWKLRGGIGDPQDPKGWKPLSSIAAEQKPATTGVPTYYRAEFDATPPTASSDVMSQPGAHPILRVTLDGLSRGFLWLNGHNLGRYPEKVPIKSLYLPECWLNKGQNTLTVYDEEGNSPTQIKLVVDPVATRTVE